jgi:Ca-activated chloride channel homolog
MGASRIPAEVTPVRRTLVSIHSLLALVLALPAAAQAPEVVVEAPTPTAVLPAPAADTPVFRMELDVTHVTVSVRDDDDRLVTNLTREDFVVTEDGRPQDVLVFGNALDGTTIEEDGTAGAGAGRAGGKRGRDLLALDLGLLLDTSESMLKELRLSKQAAVRFLDTIPRARELFTIFFDEEIRLSRYDSENQQGLFERIHELKGGGNTALFDAIATYISRVQGAPGRKTLVLFSDGEDSRSSLGLGEFIEVVRSSGVTIYPIAFSGGFSPGSSRALKAKVFLQQIAEMTGGQVFSPHSSRELAAIFQKILDELAAQYVLGFVSSNTAQDGRFRKLKVELKRPGLKVRHRHGYYAPLPTTADK